jgi:DNA helicase-2/ATP-dependent DNA helicase PcrA
MSAPDRASSIAEALAAAPAAQGVLVVESERGERTYLLGPRTALDGEAPMLDWRTAPLAEAFFRHGPGELYEVEAGDRLTAGKVLERWLIAGRGTVDALIGDTTTLVRDGAGFSQTERPRPAPVPAPRGAERAEIVLDADQQRAVDLTADTSLVVDGEAGVGKTLVALYRIASLQRRAREHGRRFRALVLVPTEGLRRLVRILADRLDITKLDIEVIDPWLVERAHMAFPGLPKRLSEGANAQVIALKRHPAVRVVLDDFRGWKPPRDDDKLARSRARLLHLWGDRDRLQRILDAAGGVLEPRAITAVMAHTRIQFETTTERANRHVDKARLVALDGRSLDAGTPMEDAHTLDAEDAPVLLELARRGILPLATQLPVYDHVFVDEAQLRSPLELAAIGDAIAPNGTVTLAGDHRQATDETAYFAGWAAARGELRTQRWAEITLSITYRSVPAIASFARQLSEGRARAPVEPPADPAVWATACPNALAQAALLCWHLDALIAREPWRQIAVIARTPEHARRLHAELSRGLDPVLVLDGDFQFEPGIVVTTAPSVSGLEFDAVVIPDLAPAFYPESAELARSLYVAATRARDWLWLLTPELWSPFVER